MGKAVEMLIHGKCYVCWKDIFFGFIEALASKGILSTLKKGITSAMECTDLAAFTFATWLMRSLTL